MPPFSLQYLGSLLRSWGTPGRYLVAYSGGGDSLVLLTALAELRPHLGAPLVAVHVCHGLQVEAADWVAHAEAICQRLEVPFEVLHLVVEPQRGESLEAVARTARYLALAGWMQAGDLLLTAHHQEDQAETLLLQLLRGSGLGGLAAMPVIAPFPPGRLGRPLLGFRRGALRHYAQERALTWVEDPSNRDLRRDRNYLRHRVLPLIAERWPAWCDTLARSAAHCAEANGLIQTLAETELGHCGGILPGTLSIPRLLNLDSGRRRVVLRHWLVQLGLPSPDSRHLQRVVEEVMVAGRDRNPQVRWPGCEVRRYRDQLFALPLLPAPPQGVLPWSGERLTLPAGLGVLCALPGENPVIAPGWWEQGRTQVVFGARGLSCHPTGQAHRWSLKKLYQAWGIPAWLRPYLPLVLLDGELVAIGDGLLCQVPWVTARSGRSLVWTGHPWPDLWQALSAQWKWWT